MNITQKSPGTARLKQRNAQHGGHSLLECVSLNQCINAANLCAVSTSISTSAHGR